MRKPSICWKETKRTERRKRLAGRVTTLENDQRAIMTSVTALAEKLKAHDYDPWSHPAYLDDARKFVEAILKKDAQKKAGRAKA